MKKIATIPYLTQARNSEHYNLQSQFVRIITADFATKYSLSQLYDNYLSLFNKEDEAYLQSQALADTKEVEGKDAARDERYRHVDLSVQSKQLSTVPAEVEAADEVSFAMGPYAKAPSKPYGENTAMIIDLVKKLQSPEYSSYIQTLGLTDAVAALKAANDEFITVYSRRANEKRIRTITETLKTIRPQVDDAASNLFEAINAFYMVNELTDKDQAKETALGAVIDAINAEILQFTETLSRRGVGTKAKIEPNDKPIVPPDEGGGGDRPEIE